MTFPCFIMVKLCNALCILECFLPPLISGKLAFLLELLEGGPAFEREFQKLRALALSCCCILHAARSPPGELMS